MNNLKIQKDALGNDLSMLLLYAYSTSCEGVSKTVICKIKNIGDNRVTVEVEDVYEFVNEKWRSVPNSGQAVVKPTSLFKITENLINF